MKNISTATRNIGELNLALKSEFDTAHWTFIFKKIAYNEVVFDADKGTVTYPDFIPLEEMIQDVIDRMDQEQTVTCMVCNQVFDMNEEDGIFGDPENLKRFLCMKCSKETSAHDFYFRFLKV